MLQNLMPLEGGLSFEEVAFSWTLLLDRIPTKANLAYRGFWGADESNGVCFAGAKMNWRFIFSFIVT